MNRFSLSELVGTKPKNGSGRDFFEKYILSLSETRFATNASNRTPLQSEISPTNVRPRVTPGVFS